MSSRLTMVLAGIFLLGAILAGYWGLRLSQPAEPAPAAPVAETAPAQPTVPSNVEDTLRHPVVVLKRAVAANTALAADDLGIERLLNAPPGSFDKPDSLIGRTVWRDLPAGTWLDESSFQSGGPLARMIHPDERAVAVAVDDVIGAAGQLSPGDYVDVLLFLRQDNQNIQSTAQVVMQAIRVLSVGDRLGIASDGRTALPPTDPSANRGMQPPRTVVLAVPEQLASPLMLAAQQGALRLAVRSADEKRLQRYWAGQDEGKVHVADAGRELYRFNQLAMGPVPRSTEGGAPAAAAAPVEVTIIRGNATQATALTSKSGQ